MTVSFHSPFPEAATSLFEMAFDEVAHTFQHSKTGAEDHYMFRDDTLIRDVRSWCADAFGCGLITMSAITVSY
jgi:hypothetical protein